ncbi:MAG: VOC family protein [Bryobacterales bacterium]|nr:VOC family protein [Bryobacterales bacterium]
MSYKAPGFATATPYLCIEGAAAALAFYKQAFGAVETHMDTTESGSIRHAEFRIGDSMFMLSDYKPEFAFLASTQQNRAPGISIFLYVPDADAVFNAAVAAGAKPVMPMEDKPYGRTGGVQDPFGILWWPTTHAT